MPSARVHQDHFLHTLYATLSTSPISEAGYLVRRHCQCGGLHRFHHCLVCPYHACSWRIYASALYGSNAVEGSRLSVPNTGSRIGARRIHLDPSSRGDTQAPDFEGAQVCSHGGIPDSNHVRHSFRSFCEPRLNHSIEPSSRPCLG